jgi:hypothetical protein
MAIYTVIQTSHVDDYKRPATDTTALITTADYTEAVTVAANTWLQEFQSDFVYDNDCESPLIGDLKALLSDEPSAETIVEFFENNHHQIWEPEFIYEPWFSVSIQETESESSVSLSREVIDGLMSVNG